MCGMLFREMQNDNQLILYINDLTQIKVIRRIAEYFVLRYTQIIVNLSGFGRSARRFCVVRLTAWKCAAQFGRGRRGREAAIT